MFFKLLVVIRYISGGVKTDIGNVNQSCTVGLIRLSGLCVFQKEGGEETIFTAKVFPHYAGVTL